MENEIVARRMIASGSVQGNGYINFVHREAKKLGVNGYACSLKDGKIEIWAEGAAEKVEELRQACRKGPPRAWVSGLLVSEVTPEGHASFFRKIVR